MRSSHSTASLLVLGLRGGGESGLAKSVLCSLLANSVAIAMQTLTTTAGDAKTFKGPRRVALPSLFKAVLRAFAVGFACYFITYLLTGFVPMGSVTPNTHPYFYSHTNSRILLSFGSQVCQRLDPNFFSRHLGRLS